MPSFTNEDGSPWIREDGTPYKEPDHIPPLPKLTKMDPVIFFDRTAEQHERKEGGFRPGTPSYTDITSLREGITQINLRLNNLEAAVMGLVKVVGGLNLYFKGHKDDLIDGGY